MKCLYRIFVVLLFVLFSGEVIAQCPSNKAQLEIAAGYGAVNSDNFTEGLNNTNAMPGKSGNHSGTPFLIVRYFLFNRLGFGAFAGTANEQGWYGDHIITSKTVSYKKVQTTVALELYYIYTFRKRLEVYTSLGVGPAFISTETTTYLNPADEGTIMTAKEEKIKAHYTPLGVRYGGRLGCFLELGIGYKGFINGGISCKFGSPCWWKL